MATPRLGQASRSLRGRIAITTKIDPESSDLPELRRDFKVARAEDYIRDLVAVRPPLTESQRLHLASLLVSAGGEQRAA